MSNSDWKDGQLEPLTTGELREISRATIAAQAEEITRLQAQVKAGDALLAEVAHLVYDLRVDKHPALPFEFLALSRLLRAAKDSRSNRGSS